MNGQCPHLVAKFDFYARDPDELTIVKGEELILLEATFHWWKVMNSNGIVGYVPNNHVKMIRETTKTPTLLSNFLGTFNSNKQSRCKVRYNTITSTLPYFMDDGKASSLVISDPNQENMRTASPMGTFKSNCYDTYTADGYHNLNKYPSTGNKRTPVAFHHSTATTPSYATTSSPYQQYQPVLPRPPPSKDPRVPFHCQVLYPYNSKLPDEMTVSPGDIIKVTKQSPDNWWYGFLLRKNAVVSSGWFPANFVQSINQFDGNKAQQGRIEKPGVSTNTTESIPYYRQNVPISSANVHGIPSDNGITPGSQLLSPPPPPSYGEPAQMIDGEALRLSHVLRSKSLGQYLNQPWCWGGISRGDAEVMLTQFSHPGEFIVRDSESLPGDIVITVNGQNRIWNFKIHVDSGRYHIGTRVFGRVDDVINHYHKYFILNDSIGNVFLDKPFSHPGFVNTAFMVNNKPVCLPVYRIYDTP